MSVLARLQRWYASQCDGEWEHDFGVSITTLDNPGWLVTIDLKGTSLEDVPFAEISDLAPVIDWIDCRVKDQKFQGAGGPFKLEEILTVFLQWAESAGTPPPAEHDDP